MKQYKNIDEFQSYLKSLENKEKIERSKIITKTTLPVLGINNPTLKNIAKDIYKNDFLNFLDLMIWDYYENTIINGYLINKIKDFNTFKHYLDIYSKKVDNWASCDVLKFNVKNNEENFFNLSLEYSQSNLPFVRRIGMYILFDFIKIDNYINKIFHQLDTFTY